MKTNLTKAYTWQTIGSVTIWVWFFTIVMLASLCSCSKSESIDPITAAGQQTDTTDKNNMEQSKDSVHLVVKTKLDVNHVNCQVNIKNGGVEMKTGGEFETTIARKKGDVLTIKMRVSFYKEKGGSSNVFTITDKSGKVLFIMDTPTRTDEIGIHYYEDSYEVK